MWLALKPILGFFKGIPWQVYAALLLGAAFLFYGSIREKEGKEEVRAEWNASIERGKAEVERLKAEAGKVTVRVETQTVEKIKYIEVQGKEREKIVYQFVPVDTPDLPAGFRVFHDAAVEGRIPDSASIATGEAVPVTDVASTINYNYSQCHKAYEVVEGWQSWYVAQKQLHESSVPQNGPRWKRKND